MQSKTTRKPMRPRINSEHREVLRAFAFEQDTTVSAIVNEAIALYVKIDLDRVRQAAQGDGLTVPDFVSGALTAALAEAGYVARELAAARESSLAGKLAAMGSVR